MTRVYQALLYSWSTESSSLDFKAGVSGYVKLLEGFRGSQIAGGTLDYEITDVGLPDIVRISDIALKDFLSSPRSAKERKELYPISTRLKQLWYEEGRKNAERAKMFKNRKGIASTIRIAPESDLALSEQLESLVNPLLPKSKELERKAMCLVHLLTGLDSRPQMSMWRFIRMTLSISTSRSNAVQLELSLSKQIWDTKNMKLQSLLAIGSPR
jgi:hypothetical protein